MILSENVARKNLVAIVLVTVVLWIVIVSGWRLVESLPGFAASALAWRKQSTGSSGFWTIGLCLIMVIVLAFAQQTRNVRTLPGAALLGALMSLLGVFGVIGAAPEELAVFAIAREAIVTLGCIGASCLLLAIRREWF